MLNKIPKINLKASKLWMPRPQNSIFQHPLEPEAGPEGGIRKYQCNDVFSEGFYVEHNTQNSCLKASKLWMPGCQDSIFQHPLEPEGGFEGDIKKNQLSLF